MPNLFHMAFKVNMEAETDIAEVKLYGEIVEDGPRLWKWSIEDKCAAEFDEAIKEVKEKGAKKLLLRINSPGGVCTEAVAMRGILLTAGFEEINIRIEGMCASAATDLATIPGAHVSIFEGAEYMIHNPWCRAIGNANDMEKVIERLRNIEQTSRNFYMVKTGQTEEQIKAWMDNETWFTAEQAVEYGFADELIKAEVEVNAVACVSDRAMQTMKDLYHNVPEQITVEPEEPENNVSNTGKVAVNKSMEEKEMVKLEDLTPEQIAQLQGEGAKAERQRISDIKAMTVPGYEAIANQAIEEGTSVVEFNKKLVAAMKEKGTSFMIQRAEETKPASNVTGGAPDSKSEGEKIEENAKEIAAYANEMVKTAGNMF